MESSGNLRPLDESLLRELPQLRIAPLREPVSSRTFSIPSPLEPNASGARDSNKISNPTQPSSTVKASLPTVAEFLTAARTKTAESTSVSASVSDPQSSVELPPKPILPAFVNLRALERFPFSSSFGDDALYGPRKRRRLDLQSDSFGEHLQLPIPQAQKEQRPPPFGPFAILNGLNEPPPNAALLPPIEAGSITSGSITQLLTKRFRGEGAVDNGSLVAVNDLLAEDQPVERREARIEELLIATLDENNDDDLHDYDSVGHIARAETKHNSDFLISSKLVPQNDLNLNPTLDGEQPLSPKTRGRSRKNMRKWTDEETIDLLRGAIKCGIGNWTSIIAQPELKFDKRSPSNLKDRFRVCCPGAYRALDGNDAQKQLHDKLNSMLHPGAGLVENSPNAYSKMHLPFPSPMIGLEQSSGSNSSANSVPTTSFASDADPGSTESHQIGSQFMATSSKLQTPLKGLDIPESNLKIVSKRRSRRLFTETEDEALLKGYAVHGFQWTLIKQDKRLNLGHRKATDLRDRFRTKFPHAYRDGGTASGKASPLLQQIPGSATSATASGSGSRDGPSGDATPAKFQSINQHHATTNVHSRHPSNASQVNAGTLDSSFLPPPQCFLEPSAGNPISFILDDTSAGGTTSPWEDNTLAPMAWDDIG